MCIKEIEIRSVGQNCGKREGKSRGGGGEAGGWAREDLWTSNIRPLLSDHHFAV